MTAVGLLSSSESHQPSFRRQVGKPGGDWVDEFMPANWQATLHGDPKLCAGFKDCSAEFVQKEPLVPQLDWVVWGGEGPRSRRRKRLQDCFMWGTEDRYTAIP
jgi:hypothetical protein